VNEHGRPLKKEFQKKKKNVQMGEQKRKRMANNKQTSDLLSQIIIKEKKENVQDSLGDE
jgi:hypothetical protein